MAENHIHNQQIGTIALSLKNLEKCQDIFESLGVEYELVKLHDFIDYDVSKVYVLVIKKA